MQLARARSSLYYGLWSWPAYTVDPSLGTQPIMSRTKRGDLGILWKLYVMVTLGHNKLALL